MRRGLRGDRRGDRRCGCGIAFAGAVSEFADRKFQSVVRDHEADGPSIAAGSPSNPAVLSVGGLEEKRLPATSRVEPQVCFLLLAAHTPWAHPLVCSLVPVSAVAWVGHPLEVLEDTAVPMRRDVVYNGNDDDGPAGVLEPLHLFLDAIVHDSWTAVGGSRTSFERLPIRHKDHHLCLMLLHSAGQHKVCGFAKRSCRGSAGGFSAATILSPSVV